MSTNLTKLTDTLFAQIKRLEAAELSSETIEIEIKRTSALTMAADQIIRAEVSANSIKGRGDEPQG